MYNYTMTNMCCVVATRHKTTITLQTNVQTTNSTTQCTTSKRKTTKQKTTKQKTARKNKTIQHQQTTFVTQNQTILTKT